MGQNSNAYIAQLWDMMFVCTCNKLYYKIDILKLFKGYKNKHKFKENAVKICQWLVLQRTILEHGEVVDIPKHGDAVDIPKHGGAVAIPKHNLGDQHHDSRKFVQFIGGNYQLWL